MYELTPILEKTNTIVAYTRADLKISKMADLRGKRAAFPRYDGVSWHAVKTYLEDKEKITCKEFSSGFFKKVCAPGGEGKENEVKNCYEDGEDNAFTSLMNGTTDVAFVSMKTYNKFVSQASQEGHTENAIISLNIAPLCPDEMKTYCFLSWSSIGHVFASNSVTEVRRMEIINVFGALDKMFGKHPPFHTPMFLLYGVYNHRMDVLFHNNTRLLAQNSTFYTHPFDKIPRNYEKRISSVKDFECSFGGKMHPSFLLPVFAVVIAMFS